MTNKQNLSGKLYQLYLSKAAVLGRADKIESKLFWRMMNTVLSLGMAMVCLLFIDNSGKGVIIPHQNMFSVLLSLFFIGLMFYFAFKVEPVLKMVWYDKPLTAEDYRMIEVNRLSSVEKDIFCELLTMDLTWEDISSSSSVNYKMKVAEMQMTQKGVKRELGQLKNELNCVGC